MGVTNLIRLFLGKIGEPWVRQTTGSSNSSTKRGNKEACALKSQGSIQWYLSIQRVIYLSPNSSGELELALG